MKLKSILMTTLLVSASLAFYGCNGGGGGGGDHDDHEGHDDDKGEHHDDGDHEGHDDDKGEHHDDGDKGHDDHKDGEHAEAEAEGEGDDHGHDHDTIIAGPNGGRVFVSIEPHAEFLVTDDRKVQVSFLGEDNKTAVPVAAQVVNVIAGERSNPTRLAFAKQGDVLISDGALPGGNDFPTVVQIKSTPDAKTVIEKFNLNLSDCPTCEYQEYACICDHDEDEEHEHEHEHKDE